MRWMDGELVVEVHCTYQRLEACALKSAWDLMVVLATVMKQQISAAETAVERRKRRVRVGGCMVLDSSIFLGRVRECKGIE